MLTLVHNSILGNAIIHLLDGLEIISEVVSKITGEGVHFASSRVATQLVEFESPIPEQTIVEVQSTEEP